MTTYPRYENCTPGEQEIIRIFAEDLNYNLDYATRCYFEEAAEFAAELEGKELG